MNASNPLLNIILDDTTFPQHTELIDAQTAEEIYKLSNHIRFPFLDFADGDEGEFQEIRLYKGDLHVSAIKSTDTRPWGLYSLIVDGNLTVDEDIDWGEDNLGSFIYVTGNVKARNIFLIGNPEIIILGNADVRNSIMACDGHDGGRLVIMGRTTAKYILGMYHFYLTFGSAPEALMVVDTDELGQFEEFTKLFLRKYINGKVVECDDVREALRQGEDIFHKV